MGTKWLALAVGALVLAGCGGSDDADLAASSVTTTSLDLTTTTVALETTTTTAAPTTTTRAPLSTTTRPVATTAPPAQAATTAAPTTQPPLKTASLSIQNFAFSPSSLQLATNTKVTVTNKDAANHTWTADGGQWNSGSLGLNGTFSHTFTAAGTYAYHCDIHPSMTGTVTVS